MIENIMRVFTASPVIVLVFMCATVLLAVSALRQNKKTSLSYTELGEIRSRGSASRKLRIGVAFLAFISCATLAFASIYPPTYDARPDPPQAIQEDVVMIVDISGSMTNEKQFAVVREAMLRTIGAHPNSRIGLVFFSSYAFYAFLPTKNHELFSNFVKDDFVKSNLVSSISGGTDGPEGIVEAMRFLNRSRAAQKRIVFIGDMQDNDYVKFFDALSSIRKNNIELDLVMVTSTPASGNLFVTVQGLATSQGASFLAASTIEEAEVIGPLPEFSSAPQDISLSSAMSREQIVAVIVGFMLFCAFVCVNWLVRRVFTLRRME